MRRQVSCPELGGPHWRIVQGAARIVLLSLQVRTFQWGHRFFRGAGKCLPTGMDPTPSQRGTT
ncbi:hypothetical protein SGPA1_22041 [Streptomyces misionensis JCM 4497]